MTTIIARSANNGDMMNFQLSKNLQLDILEKQTIIPSPILSCVNKSITPSIILSGPYTFSLTVQFA
jgi:hypothetical protein